MMYSWIAEHKLISWEFEFYKNFECFFRIILLTGFCAVRGTPGPLSDFHISPCAVLLR